MYFATYTADSGQLRQAITLAESLRTFGGRYASAHFRVYLPKELAESSFNAVSVLHGYDAETKTCTVLPDLERFPFGGKVTAAVRAGDLLPNGESVLVFLDPDTIILREPAELELAPTVRFAYRPAMHRNIGSLWGEPPDPFWARVYKVLHIPEEALFPMTTAASGEVVRTYFNAGLVALRPGYGILLWWARCFMMLAANPEIQQMCREDELKRTFLHQAALVAPPLTRLNREEMLELPPTYNYPLFFDRAWPATQTFDNLDGVVTLRYGHAFENAPTDMAAQLKGDPQVVRWVLERILP